MAPKALDFKCAIVTGAAGGLGKAMSSYLVSQGKKVILVGRTESNLQEASKDLKNAPYYILDTGNIADVKPFVQKVTSEHPEVDCLINNAGVQRPLDVHDFDLDSADQEIDIDIRGPLHLAISLLPHFKARKDGAVIMNVTSVLGFLPFSIINPVYNGCKAFQHMFTLNLRTQLANTNVRVIEIAPPAVGTDLHRDREDPDDNKKHKNSESLTVEEFMEQLVEGWKNDDDLISAGPGKAIIKKWNDAFGEKYDGAAQKYIDQQN